MFATMNPSCVDAARICEAAAFVNRFPAPDARKPAESPFAAFLLSKVGKQAVKSLAIVAETAAKADFAAKEFAKGCERIKDFTKLETITVSVLRMEVMPLLRQAKNCSKGADAVAVEEVLSVARALFSNFEIDLVGRMFRCAPFLCEQVVLFDATPAPAKDFQEIVGELKAGREMWHEVYTEILPAAAAGTAAASLLDINKFIMYAELAQELAAATLSETPAPSLQSLRGRLLDLLQPEAWASIEKSVTGPTLETPPHL